MEDGEKHQLEGLLKARAEDLRNGRHVRTRGLDAGARTVERRRPVEETPAPSRMCDDCGGEIPAGRLRAMPAAQRCIECQRAAELDTART